MTHRLFPSLILLAFLSWGSALWAQTTRPVPQIERVVIISIDGCRPDVLLRANCPAVRSLMANGSFTFWAQTTAVAITLPSHVSMLTGVPPVKHGIMWNEDLPLSKPFWPRYPTIFELAHQAGYSTSLVSGKGKFKQLLKPDTVDWSKVNDGNNDLTVADDAVEILKEHRPQVLMVHFPGGDIAGHRRGWGSDEQVKVLEMVDQGIARILATLGELGLREHVAVLVTADHGGAGRGHGADDIRSREIPWIISGPGIRRNYDLTRIPTLQVNTEDTFGTAAYLMGLTPRPGTDGKPITEVLVDRDLTNTN